VVVVVTADGRRQAALATEPVDRSRHPVVAGKHQRLREALAADAEDPAGCTDPSGATLDGDQRGDPRPAGNRCDTGALEIQ
jgi:hypothetical protein